MQYSFWDDFGLPSFALSLAVASTCVYRVPGRVAGSAVAYRRHFVCFHLLLGLALLSHIAVTVRMITCFFTFYCLTLWAKEVLCFRSFVLRSTFWLQIHALDEHEF